MKLVNVSLVLWWCLVGCTPEGVDPAPDPPSTTTTVVSTPPTTTIPSEPPDGPRPSDYIKLVRVEGILEWQSSTSVGLIAGAQSQHWAGSLDVWNVLSKCPSAFEGNPPYLGLTKAQADAFADIGGSLTALAQQDFIPRFPRVNRRCYPGHAQHHPDFCNVTNIRKSRYGPFGALGDSNTPRGEFWVHLDRAHEMANLAGQCRGAIVDAGGRAYDSIAGWCTEMNGLGWTAEDCR